MGNLELSRHHILPTCKNFIIRVSLQIRLSSDSSYLSCLCDLDTCKLFKFCEILRNYSFTFIILAHLYLLCRNNPRASSARNASVAKREGVASPPHSTCRPQRSNLSISTQTPPLSPSPPSLSLSCFLLQSPSSTSCLASAMSDSVGFPGAPGTGNPRFTLCIRTRVCCT